MQILFSPLPKRLLLFLIFCLLSHIFPDQWVDSRQASPRTQLAYSLWVSEALLILYHQSFRFRHEKHNNTLIQKKQDGHHCPSCSYRSVLLFFNHNVDFFWIKEMFITAANSHITIITGYAKKTIVIIIIIFVQTIDY